MQPYFFPYLGYFQLIEAVDTFVIYDDVNFVNRGWINRNNILINGKGSQINVPLVGASQNKLIKEICLTTDLKWRNKLLRTIELNYKKAPHFEKVFKILQHTINHEAKSISEYNYISIKAVCRYLGINTMIIPSSEVYSNSELKGQNRILDICKKLNAQYYFNLIGGIELYNKSTFLSKEINLIFLQTEMCEYKQFRFDFIPFLSIIDVLMFNTVDEIRLMLQKWHPL
jgi:hypothetical protein